MPQKAVAMTTAKPSATRRIGKAQTTIIKTVKPEGRGSSQKDKDADMSQDGKDKSAHGKLMLSFTKHPLPLRGFDNAIANLGRLG